MRRILLWLAVALLAASCSGATDDGTLELIPPSTWLDIDGCDEDVADRHVEAARALDLDTPRPNEQLTEDLTAWALVMTKLLNSEHTELGEVDTPIVERYLEVVLDAWDDETGLAELDEEQQAIVDEARWYGRTINGMAGAQYRHACTEAPPEAAPVERFASSEDIPRGYLLTTSADSDQTLNWGFGGVMPPDDSSDREEWGQHARSSPRTRRTLTGNGSSFLIWAIGASEPSAEYPVPGELACAQFTIDGSAVVALSGPPERRTITRVHLDTNERTTLADGRDWNCVAELANRDLVVTKDTGEALSRWPTDR